MLSAQNKTENEKPEQRHNVILQLTELCKSFQQAGTRLEILDDVSLHMYSGQMAGLLGPSGSGKTTLLQIAGLLDQADTGSIFIDGQNCSELPDHKRTLLRREKIGFVYQFHHLLPEFSALENLIIPQMINGVPRKQAADNATRLLEQVKLGDRLHHRPARLSGGEQQRVAIARALVNNPKLLLADEPTGSLDSVTADKIFKIFERLIQSDRTILMVTHDRGLMPRFTRHVNIADGELVEKEEVL